MLWFSSGDAEREPVSYTHLDVYKRQTVYHIKHNVKYIMSFPEEKSCRIIVLDNNVPQISLYYHPIKDDSVLQAERDDWNVSYELGDTWKNARKIKLKNSSLFKIDVLVYPQLAFKNLVITQIYQVLFDLSPAIEVSLWKGMKLTAQLKIPVYNDGYGRFEDKVHPGHITISQRFRLPDNVFGKVTVGCFSANQYLSLIHI